MPARKDSGEEAGAGGATEVVEPPPEPTRVKNLYDSADIKHQLDSVAVEVRLVGVWVVVARARKESRGEGIARGIESARVAAAARLLTLSPPSLHTQQP
jgi:hypothetical protein